jgi:hypothetical protein
MDISGAMLITANETGWIQEGWINAVDLEHHEVRGYFYLPANRDVGVNCTTELIVDGVRMYVTLVMSSITFHPQILKYRFVATGSVGALKDKLVPDENLTMTQAHFLETDFSAQLSQSGFGREDTYRPENKKSIAKNVVHPIGNFIHARAAMFERLLHTEFAKPSLKY